MRKHEIKKAKDNELIVDYVKTYSSLCLNVNCDKGIKRYISHCTDLEKEMLSRGILTEKDIEQLRI